MHAGCMKIRSGVGREISNLFITPLYERSTNGLHSVAATGKGSASSSAPEEIFRKKKDSFRRETA